MMASYLYNRFEIRAEDADARRHDPEDFVVRFRHQADRDRVLAAPPMGALLPLIWRPWRRTLLASGGSFRFRVLIGLRRVPLHALSVAMAQTILGPNCAVIDVVRPRDVQPEDDQEFFVVAWCLDPSFIPDVQVIFIPEPRFANPVEASSDCGISFVSVLLRSRTGARRRHRLVGVAMGMGRLATRTVVTTATLALALVAPRGARPLTRASRPGGTVTTMARRTATSTVATPVSTAALAPTHHRRGGRCPFFSPGRCACRRRCARGECALPPARGTQPPALASRASPAVSQDGDVCRHHNG